MPWARRSRGGTVLAADFVVVGQCPQLDAVGLGARGQLLGCQGAVGDDGMAMQVGVESGVHRCSILGVSWQNGPMYDFMTTHATDLLTFAASAGMVLIYQHYLRWRTRRDPASSAQDVMLAARAAWVGQRDA